MAPIRGWGIKGERLKGFAPDGRWRTLTFLAALRADAVRCGAGPWRHARLPLATPDALTAPCVVDGPINGAVFRAYVEQFLLSRASFAQISKALDRDVATRSAPTAPRHSSALVSWPGSIQNPARNRAFGITRRRRLIK